MRVWNFGIKVCKVLGFGVLVLGVWVGVLDFRVQVYVKPRPAPEGSSYNRVRRK